MSLTYHCDACRQAIAGEPAVTLTGAAVPRGRIDLCASPACATAGLAGLLKAIRPAQRGAVSAAARAIQIPASLVRTGLDKVVAHH